MTLRNYVESKLTDYLVEKKDWTIADLKEKLKNRSGTHGHCSRVQKYAGIICEELGIAGTVKDEIVEAGYLHDVGKLCYPEDVMADSIGHRREITKDEYKVFQLHAGLGAKLIEGLVNERIHDYVQHHQEKFNGKGYPHQLRKDDISLGAKILNVADVYDAISTRKVEEDSDLRTLDECLEIMEEEKGKGFDPEIAEVFIDYLKRPKTV